MLSFSSLGSSCSLSGSVEGEKSGKKGLELERFLIDTSRYLVIEIVGYNRYTAYLS